MSDDRIMREAASAQKILAGMTPEDREAMYAKQRESFARGMTTPCEHGRLDFEQCPECRPAAIRAMKGE